MPWRIPIRLTLHPGKAAMTASGGAEEARSQSWGARPIAASRTQPPTAQHSHPAASSVRIAFLTGSGQREAGETAGIRAAHRATGANCPRIRAQRASGSSSTWVPILPPLTMMVSWPLADWSIKVGNSFFIPTGEQPPRT